MSKGRHIGTTRSKASTMYQGLDTIHRRNKVNYVGLMSRVRHVDRQEERYPHVSKRGRHMGTQKVKGLYHHTVYIHHVPVPSISNQATQAKPSSVNKHKSL